jgi:hypothetical protein
MKLYTWRLLGFPGPLRPLDKYGKRYSPYRIFRIWENIKKRSGVICRKSYQRVRSAKYYTNVKLCEEWRSFANFYRWAMSHGYREDLSIDRIDNEKGYSPDNCRWVTRSVQNKNRRMTEEWRKALCANLAKGRAVQARRRAEKERGKCCVASR